MRESSTLLLYPRARILLCFEKTLPDKIPWLSNKIRKLGKLRVARGRGALRIVKKMVPWVDLDWDMRSY